MSAVQPPVSEAAHAPLSAQAAALLLSALSIAARALIGSFHLFLSAFLLHVASVAASAASLCVSPLSSILHVANSNAASTSDEPLLTADAAAAGGRNEETQKDNGRLRNAIGQQYPPLLLYGGHVAHHRSHPTRHGFNYAVRYALVNLDAPPDWFARSSARHHMSADEARSFAGTDGPVFLLTNPTSMGYEQNPISVYYCYRACSSTAANGSSSESEGEQEPLLPPAESLAVCIGESALQELPSPRPLALTSPFQSPIHSIHPPSHHGLKLPLPNTLWTNRVIKFLTPILVASPPFPYLPLTSLPPFPSLLLHSPPSLPLISTLSLPSPSRVSNTPSADQNSCPPLHPAVPCPHPQPYPLCRPPLLLSPSLPPCLFSTRSIC
ncbi:unnamed protein product [Closterium sp. Yama58-4]|nr:unnamed protein product [Closterium sp. Yama58-4]